MLIPYCSFVTTVRVKDQEKSHARGTADRHYGLDFALICTMEDIEILLNPGRQMKNSGFFLSSILSLGLKLEMTLKDDLKYQSPLELLRSTITK